MALTIPNLEASPTFDAQAIPDSTDLAAQLAAMQQTGVLTGMGVTPSSLMTVAVAAGTYLVAGVKYTYAGGTIAAGAASASDRKDIVSINTSGTVAVTAGTACGTAGWSHSTASPFTNPPPVKPAIPANSVLLGELYIANTTTTVAAGNIIDKTALVLGTSAVQLTNGVTAPITYKSANYTALNSDTCIVYTGITARTLTLAASPVGGQVITISSFAPLVTVAPNASQTLCSGVLASGNDNLFVPSGQCLTLTYDATNANWSPAFTSTVFPNGTSTAEAAKSGVSAGNSAFVTATAVQITKNNDVMVYCNVATAGTVVLAISPDNTTYYTIQPSVVMPIGTALSWRVPAGWYTKFTLTTAVLSTYTYVPC